MNAAQQRSAFGPAAEVATLITLTSDDEASNAAYPNNTKASFTNVLTDFNYSGPDGAYQIAFNSLDMAVKAEVGVIRPRIISVSTNMADFSRLGSTETQEVWRSSYGEISPEGSPYVPPTPGNEASGKQYYAFSGRSDSGFTRWLPLSMGQQQNPTVTIVYGDTLKSVNDDNAIDIPLKKVPPAPPPVDPRSKNLEAFNATVVSFTIRRTPGSAVATA